MFKILKRIVIERFFYCTQKMESEINRNSLPKGILLTTMNVIINALKRSYGGFVCELHRDLFMCPNFVYSPINFS